jgi:uncharacterized protein YuzB (UPF0349 family)
MVQSLRGEDIVSYGFIVVEVCDANACCTAQLFELEQEFSGVSVLEAACMSHCELCATSPYVFVNGDIITADDVPLLLSAVRTKIEQLLCIYENDN